MGSKGGGFAARAIGLCGLVMLGGCGELLDSVPPRPAAIDDPVVAETPFPRLAEVPARPQITYDLDERRAIADGLVADRDNARHQGNELRQQAGQAPLPPAPPLPPRPPAKAEPPPDPAADLAIAYVEDSLARDADDGSLGDFLDALERLPPGIDAAAAQAGTAALPPTEATPSASGLPLRVIFRYDSADLDPDQEVRLRAAGALLGDSPGPIVVSAGGGRAGPAGLAMERAHRVAALLVDGGLDEAGLSIEIHGEMGGDGDEVIVYQPDGGSG